MSSREDLQGHWRRAQALTAALLVIWFAISFVLPWFAPALEPIHFFGWPLPFYMAAQGGLIVYVAIIGVYAVRMRALDREYGLEESDAEIEDEA